MCFSKPVKGVGAYMQDMHVACLFITHEYTTASYVGTPVHWESPEDHLL